MAVVTIYPVIVVLGLSNTISYHRLLSHRSLKTAPWLRYAITFVFRREGHARRSRSPVTLAGMLWAAHVVLNNATWISEVVGDGHSGSAATSSLRDELAFESIEFIALAKLISAQDVPRAIRAASRRRR